MHFRNALLALATGGACPAVEERPGRMKVRVAPLRGECDQGRGPVLDQRSVAADLVKEAVGVQAKGQAMSLADFPCLRERLFCFHERSIQMTQVQ